MFGLALLLGRLWYLQMIRGENLRLRSENNRIRFQEIKPLRGLILDTRGRILVDNQPSFDLSIIPEATKDITKVIGILAELSVPRDAENYQKAALTRTSRPFLPIKLERNIGRDKVAIVETNSLSLPGVIIDIVPVRKYIYGSALAHVLGYVGEISNPELEERSHNKYKAGDIIGKYGIEKYLDKYLCGKSGGEQVEVNVNGRKLKVLGSVASIPGDNVVLTIDADLQELCQNAFSGLEGIVTVMDPRDGSILAMVSRPSFDPNLFNRGISGANWDKLSSDALSPLQNRAIAGQYPPGSIYKLIVAAAALEEGLITKEKTFFCDGTFRMGNRTFRCWKKGGHGVVDLHRAIVESCDVYFYNLGEMLGVNKLAEYSRKFGLGSKTGVMLPGERGGLVPTKEWKIKSFEEPWQKGETISLSIGQGFLLVTPLQLLNAYSAIANGGNLYRPRIVKEIKTAKGQLIKEYLPEKITDLHLSKEHIEVLRKALWGVVNEDRGTGRALMRPQRDVSGKTGTAQVIRMPDDDEEDVYQGKVPYKFRDHALFVCFAPYDTPEIAVIVIVEHGGHGGSAAAPVARKIIDWYFQNKVEKPSSDGASV
ncbi:MAG: penicillin-binding protein 2 [Deltaproteobacteria bacterium]|nr:penicillin-binding protein 2 [Deltaproteobacteria bacterium]